MCVNTRTHTPAHGEIIWSSFICQRPREGKAVALGYTVLGSVCSSLPSHLPGEVERPHVVLPPMA